MTRIRSALLPLVLIGALALSACTAAPAPEASDAASPAPDASASASAEPEPEVVVADSCAAIDTTESTVDGTALGTCISDALHAVGTMKAQGVLDGETQVADVRLRPDVAIHSTSPSQEVVFLDGVAYSNDGSGWVEGDPDSDDPEKMVIGNAGLLLVALFTGDVLKESIAACPVWNIETGTQKLTLPDDIVVDARTFTCAGPFQSAGATVDPMHVWIGADWTPYGYESTATAFGEVVSGVSYYYDHGAPVEITAPM